MSIPSFVVNFSAFKDDENDIQIKVIQKLMEIIDFLKRQPISALSAKDDEANFVGEEAVNIQQTYNKLILVHPSNFNACNNAVKALLNVLKNVNDTTIDIKIASDLVEAIYQPNFKIFQLAVQALINVFFNFDANSQKTFPFQISQLPSKTKNTPAKELLMNILYILKVFCLQSTVLKILIKTKDINALENIVNSANTDIQKKSAFILAGLIFTSKILILTPDLCKTSIHSAVVRFLYSHDLEVKNIATASFFMCGSTPNRAKLFAISELLTLIDFPNNVIREVALIMLGYNVRESFEKLQCLIDFKGIQRIVDLLECTEPCSSAVFALECCLYGTNEQKQAIVEANVVPTLVRLLHSLNERIIIGSLNILGGTAVIKEQTDAIIKAEVFPKLVEMVKSENEKIRIWSIYVLRNMVIHPSTGRKAIIHSGVISILLPILDAADLKTTSYIVVIIACILAENKNIKEDLINAGIIVKLIKLLNVKAVQKSIPCSMPDQNDEITNNAVYSLMIISSGGKNHIQAIIDTGGITALNEMLLHNDLKTTYYAVTAIKIISEGDVKQKEAIVEAGVIPNLIKLLNASDEKVSSVAMKAITNLLLCESEKFIEVIVDAGVILKIVELLEYDNLSTITNALASLLFITKECCIEETIRTGAIPSLFEILEKFDNDDICKLAGQLLSVLATIDESVISDSIDLLLSSNWITCKHVARILTLILQNNPDSVKEMIKNGILLEIVKLFQTFDVNRCKVGGWLIVWIYEDHIQEIIDAGIVPYLVRLLEFDEQPNMIHSKHDTKDVFSFLKLDICDRTAGALGFIALGNTKQKDVVIQSGAIPSLVKLMQSTNPSIRESATVAIANIVMDSTIEQKQAIINAGALPYVVELLLDPVVCEQAISVLSNLAHGNSDQIQAIIDVDAIPSLIKLLDSPDSYIRESTAWVFYFITKRIHEVVTESGALPLLMNHMKLDDKNEYSAVPEILVQLTFGDHEDIKAVVDAKAISLIAQQLNSSNIEVIRPCITTIANIASDSEEYAQAVTDDGALLKIVKLLESSNSLICHEVIKDLGYLAINCPELVQIIIDAKLIPVLLKFLNSTDENVKESIAVTFSYMSMASMEQRNILVSHGVIANLVDLLDSCNDETLRGTLETFMFLSEEKVEHKQAIIDAKVLPKLVTLLLNSPSTHSAQCAINVIANLANGSKDQIQAIIESGTLPPLIKHLDSPKWFITRDAATAIANISEGSMRHKKALINAGALTLLKEVAKSEKTEVSRPAMRAIYNLQNCHEQNESMPLTFFNAKL